MNVVQLQHQDPFKWVFFGSVFCVWMFSILWRKFEQFSSLLKPIFSASELANRLSNLTNGTRIYKNSESLRNNLNAAPLNSMKSVNLIRVKELRMDNLSSLSMDFLSSKCAKCNWQHIIPVHIISSNLLDCHVFKCFSSIRWWSGQYIYSQTECSKTYSVGVFMASQFRNFIQRFTKTLHQRCHWDHWTTGFVFTMDVIGSHLHRSVLFGW